MPGHKSAAPAAPGDGGEMSNIVWPILSTEGGSE
jgi:hypothetical protein